MLRLLVDNGLYARVRPGLHFIAYRFGLPGGNSEQNVGLSDFAMQPRALRPRGLLDNSAGLYPALGVSLWRKARLHFDLKDIVHRFSSSFVSTNGLEIPLPIAGLCGVQLVISQALL